MVEPCVTRPVEDEDAAHDWSVSRPVGVGALNTPQYLRTHPFSDSCNINSNPESIPMK